MVFMLTDVDEFTSSLKNPYISKDLLVIGRIGKSMIGRISEKFI